MPTIARIGPYRFFFYSDEGSEPPHVHVARDASLGKYWLESVALARSTRFSAHELRQIEGIIREEQSAFLEAWYEYFG